MENSNNEQKSVEELAKERYPFLNMETKSDTRKKRNAFIAGHTAATEGRVKKEDVVEILSKQLTILQTNYTSLNKMCLRSKIDLLTNLLTQLNKL